MVHNEIASLLDSHLPGEDSEKWDVEAFMAAAKVVFPLPQGVSEESLLKQGREEVRSLFFKHADDLYEQIEERVSPQNMRMLERMVMLRTIDTHWVEHLTAMENMRQGIGLQAVGQLDPLVMYKRQGHGMYAEFQSRVQHGIVRTVYHVSVAQEGERRPARAPAVAPSQTQKAMAAAVGNRSRVAASAKVGRNDPCPCGSGKKYKRCHGAT